MSQTPTTNFDLNKLRVPQLALPIYPLASYMRSTQDQMREARKLQLEQEIQARSNELAYLQNDGPSSMPVI